MQCPMQASSIIKLNVGGHYFTTSLQTLTKDPNSVLGTMFSGKYETRAGEDGAVFIDRDGTHFRFILNFLRSGKLTLPEGATALAEFKEEADFYQILGILDELDDTKLKSEILTDEEQQNLLLSWLPSHGDVGRRRLRLLFRASRDGFAANTFHDKCDNKGPTIVLVQSGNYVFGGFTEKSWMKSKSCVECSSLHFKHITRDDFNVLDNFNVSSIKTAINNKLLLALTMPDFFRSQQNSETLFLTDFYRAIKVYFFSKSKIVISFHFLKNLIILGYLIETLSVLP